MFLHEALTHPAPAPSPQRKRVVQSPLLPCRHKRHSMHTHVILLASVLASSGCSGAKRLASTHAQLKQALPDIEIHDGADRCFLASAGEWKRGRVNRIDPEGTNMAVGYALDDAADATLYVYPNTEGASAQEDHLALVMQIAASDGYRVHWQYRTDMRITGLPGDGLVGLGDFKLTEQISMDTIRDDSPMRALAQALQPGMSLQLGSTEITRDDDTLNVDTPMHSMAALWTDDAWWYKLRLTWTPQDGEELSDVPVYLLEPLLPKAMAPCEFIVSELETGS